MDYSNIENNPELVEWLKSLEANVASKESNKPQRNEESRIVLPKIRMNRKLTQLDNRTLPEFQGSINFLPVSWNNQRVIELNNVYDIWSPTAEDWSAGIMYKVLEPQFYPEGEIRDRIAAVRSKISNWMKEHKDDWKTVKRKNFSLIKAFVLVHRNTKGDIVISNLYGGDELIEHRNIPALIICPVNRVQTAIQDDLNSKMNPVPFAISCYSDTPLKERQGWVSMTFKEKGGNAIGYNCTVTTDVVNPAIMPEGLIPNSVNFDDPRIKLLETCDPIKEFLPARQIGEGDQIYYNEETLKLLENRVDAL